MEALRTHKEDNRGDSMAESAPQLRSLHENKHLPSGGVFVPDPALYEDLGIPTRVYEGVERIGHFTIPLTVEIPKEIRDPHRLLLSPGYCATQKAYAGLRHACARNGQVATTYEIPQDLLNLIQYHPAHFLHPGRLLSQAPLAAIRGSRRIERKAGVRLEEESDAAGHSMGGPSDLELASLYPGLIRTIVLNQSPGLEPHNTFVMLNRLRRLKKNELKKTEDDIISQGIINILKDPLKTLREGLWVSNRNNQEKIEMLGKLGIKSAAIFGEDDSLVDGQKSLEHSGDKVDIVAFYPDPEAHHFWPQTNPFDVAMAIKQILDVLHKEESPSSAQPMPIAA
jgi:hypothetical protein